MNPGEPEMGINEYPKNPIEKYGNSVHRVHQVHPNVGKAAHHTSTANVAENGQLIIIDDSGNQSPLASSPQFRARCEFWPAFENPQLWGRVKHLWEELPDESKEEVAGLLAENCKAWPNYAIHTPLQMYYVMCRDRVEEAA